MGRMSTDKELDVAIAIGELLNVDVDNDDNLWRILEIISEDDDPLNLIRNELGASDE